MEPSDFDQYLDNGGAPQPGAPLGMLVSAYAARDPDRPALTVGDVTLTRAALEAAANRRARQLACLGIGEDVVVVVALPNGIEFYETVLAVWKLGATPAHVSYRLTDGEFSDIIALANPKLVVGGPTGATYGEALRLAEGTRPDSSLSAEALPASVAKAWKMSTSGGSTGRPKLVIDPHPAVWSEDKLVLRCDPGATIVNPGPLYHAAPFGQMFPGLCQGCYVVEMGRFDAEHWLALVERHRADWVYLVPTMMARVAKLPPAVRERYDVSSVKTLVHMAAPCPDWVKAFWIDYIGADAVWEIYGGTERFGSTLIGGREWLQHPGSVGRARQGIEIRIVDDEGRDLLAGEVGEIYFRREGGPSSTFRYLGADARIREGWASFGDHGRLDADGYLYIADRRTDMVVCGGANLYPAEIEAAIDTCPGVLGSVVVGLPDDDLGQRAHAIVQVSAGTLATISGDDILRELAPKLTITKHPRSIEFTTRAIRDDAGKVRRSAWREECLQRSGVVREPPGGAS
ncbi:MAG: AMP-binding protein [Rhizomicrobium sp.]